MSERIARVTDSTAGLKVLDPTADWNVIPLELEIDGRRYREGPDFSTASFHRLQQEANTPPKTQPPSPELFADTYRSLLECHDRVFSVHLSAGLSRTVENARAAAAGIEGGGRVTVVDSPSAPGPCRDGRVDCKCERPTMTTCTWALRGPSPRQGKLRWAKVMWRPTARRCCHSQEHFY